MTTILSAALFLILLGLTARENAKGLPKEEDPERELAQTVSVPRPKRQYVRGYYRETTA